MNADWVTRPWAGWRLEWRSAVWRANFIVYKRRDLARWAPFAQFSFSLGVCLLRLYCTGKPIRLSLLMGDVPGIIVGLFIVRSLMVHLPAAVLLLRRARLRERPVAFS